ncbi:MAG: hypothetical protein WD396_09625, partial [Pseudohongiellaceae bacterium]
QDKWVTQRLRNPGTSLRENFGRGVYQFVNDPTKIFPQRSTSRSQPLRPKHEKADLSPDKSAFGLPKIKTL